MKAALISFSNNYDMQEHMYFLQKYDNSYITIGSRNVIVKFDIRNDNYFFNVPNRPAIEPRTFNINELYKIVKLIRLHKVDTLIFISAHSWNYVLAKLLPSKIVKYHILHEIIPHSGERISVFTKIYTKQIVKSMDKFIVHSKAYVDLLPSIFPISKRDVYYMHPWMNYYEYKETKSNSNSCLFFGRLNKYKGIDNLIYLARKNKNITFKVVGKPSKEVENEINEIRNLDNVILVERYVTEEEIHNFFYESEIVILPYVEASQSGVVIEAYRHSRPVIVFDVGNLKEQVDNSKTGFVIPAGNLDSFENSIKYYLNLDIKEKALLCYNAWKFGKEKFSAEVAAEKIGNILIGEG